MTDVPPVVDVDWLAAHPEAVVADVRWYLDGGAAAGRAAFEAGHLPGARFVDLDAGLAGPPSAVAGRHPLPAPEVFAACCTAAGIGEASVVVAYDDRGGMGAGRLVWLLRILGVGAALLDGDVELSEAGAPAVAPADPPFPVRPWPAELFATADEVAAGDVTVIDARAPERYRGEVEPIDSRAGHVPGAVNVPFAGNLDADGRWLPPEALRERFAGAGRDTVVYCGSGVSACHDLLAIERAGLGRARLYAGSWSQWSADPDRPVATGY